MVHRFDGEIWIFLVDQLPECWAISLRLHIGKHRKGGLQFGQTFGCGFGTRIFFMVKNDATIVGNDRDHGFVKAPFMYGERCPALALRAKGVQSGPADTLLRRDGIGTDTLMRLWVRSL